MFESVIAARAVARACGNAGSCGPEAARCGLIAAGPFQLSGEM